MDFILSYFKSWKSDGISFLDMLLEKTRKGQTQSPPLRSGGGMGGRRARILQVN